MHEYLFIEMLETEIQDLCMLGKRSTLELYPQSQYVYFSCDICAKIDFFLSFISIPISVLGVSCCVLK